MPKSKPSSRATSISHADSPKSPSAMSPDNKETTSTTKPSSESSIISALAESIPTFAELKPTRLDFEADSGSESAAKRPRSTINCSLFGKPSRPIKDNNGTIIGFEEKAGTTFSINGREYVFEGKQTGGENIKAGKAPKIEEIPGAKIEYRHASTPSI